MLRKTLAGAAAALAIIALGLPQAAHAQSYPSKTVTIVVPLAAGTGMDTLARYYGDKLQTKLGKPFVVENKPGAALMLAAASVAVAPPHGYTLLVSTGTPLAINPVLYKKVNYDAQKDFAAVSLYAKAPFFLVVNNDLPIKSVPDLIKYTQEAKTPVTFASLGAGTPLHLAGEYMKLRYNANMNHVPYRNTGQALGDLVAGHVNISFAEAGATLPLVREGKLRLLAVTSAARLPNVPDVPTFAEAAGEPGFELVSWHALFAPSATPKDVVQRLNAEMNAIMGDPDMQQKIAAMGLMPVGTPPLAEVEAFIATERDKWGALIRKLGLEGTQ